MRRAKREEPPPHAITYRKVETTTQKAVLFDTDSGLVWVPKSVIVEGGKDEGAGSVTVAGWWWARKAERDMALEQDEGIPF